jgi:4-amino-4-deoxy-L-arabinose transferase-like glycosyltransferase
LVNRLASLATFRPNSPWQAVLWLVVGLSAARLAVLFVSPIQLYPDEAQYWVWAQTPDWGYFSKPPMVAWLIGITTAIGGDAEPWVRLSSLFLHAAATLVLFDVGRRLYDARVGLLAAVLYALMPGVQLSSGVISTDASLMVFLCAALWAYVRLLACGPSRECVIWGGGVGLFLGLAFLSKYAAAYILAGLIWHGLTSETARRAWRPRALAAAVVLLLATLGPNLVWNAHHHFATIGHTAQNANWNATNFFHFVELLDFLASQAGVFGPVPFAALLIGAFIAVRRRGTGVQPQADHLLLCLTLPAILAVSAQGLLSRANANWAFAAYGPGCVLVAAWLVRWRARRWTAATLAVQAVLAIGFLITAADPRIADRLGLGNSLKRSRGWAELSSAVLDRARQEPRIAAIVVDSRFLYNEMRYYGRDRLGAPDVPALKVWVRENRPHNQAEMSAPLVVGLSARALAVSLTPEWKGEFVRDFRMVEDRPPLSVPLDRKRSRDAALFLGTGFWPRPRDPLTGLPTPP